MTRFVQRLFLDHPDSVEETYLEHFIFAIRFSATLFLASAAALVHAFVPGLCEKTASRYIDTLHSRMHNRQG